jgi:hypothetical protein
MTRVVLYLLVTTLQEESSPSASKTNAFPAVLLRLIPSAAIRLVLSFPYKIDHSTAHTQSKTRNLIQR